MTEPITSLAITLRANRGAYAVLIGSGVSRAAGIPTGWEVIGELIRKMIALEEPGHAGDPFAWYKGKYKKEPSYSEILNSIGGTPAERSAILKSFFEATNDERRVGLKQPTVTHRAIADLVSFGLVKVILTTNFDRLMEQALSEKGISFHVISSADDISGCPPLAHSACTLVKLHGDYQDTRIRNTPEELADYSQEMNKLLDQVFDEYGVIVSGWSGSWDLALRAAFLRGKFSRYSTFWSTVSNISDEASGIVEHTRARAIRVSDADAFFDELLQKIKVLEQFEKPQGISVTFAVSLLKQFLPDPVAKIRLYDLVMTETDRVVKLLRSNEFPLDGACTPERFRETIGKYNSAIEILEALFAHAFYWEKHNSDIWLRAIERLTNIEVQNGNTVLLNLRLFPAFRLFYAAGVAASASRCYGMFADLARLVIRRKLSRDNETLAIALSPSHIVEGDTAKWLEGMDRHKIPMSSWMMKQMKTIFSQLIPDESTFMEAFDRFEYLTGLLCAELSKDTYSVPPGVYILRDDHSDKVSISELTTKQVEDEGTRWPPIRDGLFKSLESCKEAKNIFDPHLKERASRARW